MVGEMSQHRSVPAVHDTCGLRCEVTTGSEISSQFKLECILLLEDITRL